MKKAVMIIALTIACTCCAVANDKTEDKGMKVPDVKVGFKMTDKSIEARAGVDLFDMFGSTKTKAVPLDTSVSTSGGKDGMFKSMGSWISDNPWKSFGALILTAGAIYAVVDSQDSSSSKPNGASAGQGGSASSESFNLANNQGSIVFNYTGANSSGQSGRDTVPFVEEVVEE